MAGERELILKLGKKITDRVDVKLGMTKLDANSPEYYGLASVDTDEIAELAVAFNNMASSLADLENMRSVFLGNVSHDLRTPMTTISGFIDGILDGAIPPEKQDYYLGVIAQEVRRLSRLVSSLLDISRIQAGDRKFTKAHFDICEMARLILISFEAKIVAICDAFDEMICGIGCERQKVYQAVEYLKTFKGVQFDEKAVDTFLEFTAVYPAGSEVLLSDGSVARVIRQNKEFPDRPVLQMIKEKNGQDILKECNIDLIKTNNIFIEKVLE